MDSAFSYADHRLTADGKMEVSKPKAIDLSHHLSLLAKSRRSTPLKGLYQYASMPGMIALAGGTPSPEYFPFETISAEIQAFNGFPTVPPTVQAAPSSSGLLSWLFGKKKPANSTIEVVKYAPGGARDPLDINLSNLLQYSSAQGHPALQQFIKEFTAKVYQPGYEDWDVLVHVGATDGWAKVVALLCERGDPILVEEWTYPGAMGAYLPLGCPMVPIKMDGEGILPSSMDEILGNWDEKARGCRRPRLLYTVPTGQNPTGATMLGKRKKEIYDLACKYDVIICEDEPYYFLYADPWVSQKKKESSNIARQYSGPATGNAAFDEFKGAEEFLKALPPTYLTYDTQGRVIRLDTFSKTLCPGSRLGWFTCNSLFSERLLRAAECSTNAPCGMGQALTTKLLTTWGQDGYIRWLRGIKATYAMRRDWMCDAFESTFHLEFEQNMMFSGENIKGVTCYQKTAPAMRNSLLDEKRGHKGVAMMQFVPPDAGMFLWIQVIYKNSPRYHSLCARGVENPAEKFMEDLWESMAKQYTLVSPGQFFDGQTGTEHDGTEGSSFFRLSFSIASKEQIETAVKTMYRVMTEFFTKA